MPQHYRTVDEVMKQAEERKSRGVRLARAGQEAQRDAAYKSEIRALMAQDERLRKAHIRRIARSGVGIDPEALGILSREAEEARQERRRLKRAVAPGDPRPKGSAGGRAILTGSPQEHLRPEGRAGGRSILKPGLWVSLRMRTVRKRKEEDESGR